jgi:predicted metal-dependent hydrolase
MIESRDIVFLMKNKGASEPNPQNLLHAWAEGVDHYNAGRFWEAHESWERGWKDLPDPEREWVQAWIQVAGLHHLRLEGRLRPARALLARATLKLERTRDRMGSRLPRLLIEGWSETEPGKASLLLPPPL